MFIDSRLVRLGIEISGKMHFYSDLAITANGIKFGNPNQGQCEVTITNLQRSVRDYILTETSPFNRNRTPKRLTLEAGRTSTGLSLIYTGNIFRSSISQPPDQTLTIKCLTGQYLKQNMVHVSFPESVPLSRIAHNVAEKNNLPLLFEAKERSINNFSFAGSALKLVDALASLGDIDVFVDNDLLVVKNTNTARQGKTIVLSPETGLVGIPEPTETGIRLIMLFDHRVNVGSSVNLKSQLYPTFNGRYVIYKLAFQIANRDTAFYLTADCRRQTGA